MTTIPAPPDYTDKDFAAIRRRIITHLEALFPQWTDYNRSNFGTILLESFAYVGDILAYYQDNQARETKWSTAVRRSSIISLGRLINYTLDGASAATVDMDVTLSRQVSPGGTVTIPIGTYVKTAELIDPIRFQVVTADLVLGPGVNVGTMTVENSESQEDAFVAEGENGEEFTLSQVPFLDDSETVTIDALGWTRVDSFLDSGPTDRHYVVLVDEADRATLRMGDGVNGAVPPASGAVLVEYKTGGGEDGNVEAGTLVKFEPGSWSDSLGNPVTVSVTNALAASGGADRETVAQARERAPRSLRVLNRTVARQDFEDAAVQVSGVARALMLTKAEYALIPDYNYGFLWVVPDGGGTPTGVLLAAVEDYINDNLPTMLTFGFEARVPLYKAVDIEATVYLTQDADEAVTATAIREALSAYFAPLNADGATNTEIEFGFNLKDAAGDPDPLVSWSAIQNVINDTAGVRRVGTPGDGEGLLLNTLADDVDLALPEFPAAGDLVLTNGDTAGVIYSGPID